VGGVAWQVTVRTTEGDLRHLLTCQAGRENPVPRHEVVDVRRRQA
jgi:hypothetical protein